MEIRYSRSTPLSARAEELVRFDIDSIRQVAAGRHGTVPRYWLADPDQYEKNGRTLRDSTTPRLLAYSPEDHVLYANDGCNSCTHVLTEDLNNISPEGIRTLGAQNKIPDTLLARMAEIVAGKS
jgi:hypothetical protein